MSMMVDDDLSFFEGDAEESADFDPNLLLSGPLMDDDGGDFGLLNSSQSNFEPDPATFQFNGSFQKEAPLPDQLQSFQQQPHQNFNNYNQNINSQKPPHPYTHPGQDAYLPLNDRDSHVQQESQESVTIRMQELQQQIQKVQSQIQHVQYQSSQLEIQSSQGENPGNIATPQNAQGFNMQGMANNAGMLRSPPDRSVSAPVIPSSANFSRGFVEQQHPGQPPSLAAMAASLQRGPQMDDSSQSSQGQTPGNVNEAMEKLCESMRRSAMSRSMVRQFSGANAPASRGVGRSKSGGVLRGSRAPPRTKSGGLSRLSRSVQRSHSGADVLPVRGPNHDTKHRLGRDGLSGSGGPPVRGVHRNKSSQAAMGGTSRSQNDDNNMGIF